MIVNPRTELLFPPHLISDLADLRGDEWCRLVERLASLSETYFDVLAFCLMMIWFNACLGCVSGSYRFMRGCELCSQQTIARYQGTDEELIALFYQAKEDLKQYAEGDVDLVGEIIEFLDPELLE